MKPMIVLWTTKRSGRQAFESSCYVEWTEIYAAGLESMQAQRDTQLRAATVEDSAKAKAALPPSFYYFGRAFDEGEDWPAGDEMDEGVPVSHHNRTTLSSISCTQIVLVVSVTLSAVLFTPSLPWWDQSETLQICWERGKIGSIGSTTHPAPRQAARRTLPHTLHRSPGPATPNARGATLTLSARQVCNVTFHQISFVASPQK